MADVEKRKKVLIGDLQDRDPEIRNLSAEALERLQIRLSLDRMVSKMRNGEMIEKVTVIYALADLKGQAIIDVIAGSLKDPSEDVRSAAVRALGSMGDDRVLPHLVESLHDTHPVVVRSAIDAMARYTDARLLGPLMHALKNKDSGVVERALDVISRIGDRKAEDAMIHFAVKGNMRMRAIAVRALGVMDC
ncbi:MAG: HEAT repeat domain-containing protein [Thermodesulfobacteriota bacterium]